MASAVRMRQKNNRTLTEQTAQLLQKPVTLFRRHVDQAVACPSGGPFHGDGPLIQDAEKHGKHCSKWTQAVAAVFLET